MGLVQRLPPLPLPAGRPSPPNPLNQHPSSCNSLLHLAQTIYLATRAFLLRVWTVPELQTQLEISSKRLHCLRAGIPVSICHWNRYTNQIMAGAGRRIPVILQTLSLRF